jgi:hypothetical protein
MVKSRKKRTRRRRRRKDRRKSDKGGTFTHAIESPFKWQYHHSPMAVWGVGKMKGERGPSLGQDFERDFTWDGVHNKGGGRSRRRRGGSGYRRCGNYLADCQQSLVINSQNELGATGGGPPTISGGRRHRRTRHKKRRRRRHTRHKKRRKRRRRGGARMPPLPRV